MTINDLQTPGYHDCPDCDGEGVVMAESWGGQSFNSPYGEPSETEEICETCEGTGQVEDDEEELEDAA